MNQTEKTPFEGFAILELLGHRRLAGYLSEQEIAGHGFIRIDMPVGDGEETATQLVGPASVYAITPVTEEIAREIAKQAPRPVQEWDIAKLLPQYSAVYALAPDYSPSAGGGNPDYGDPDLDYRTDGSDPRDGDYSYRVEADLPDYEDDDYPYKPDQALKSGVQP